MSGINQLLRSSLESLESQIPVANDGDLYINYQIAIEDFYQAAKLNDDLGTIIDDLESLESMVGSIENYDEQVLKLHRIAVNEVKEILGDRPIEAVSVESLTQINDVAMSISNESGGMLSRAWKALVDFIVGIVKYIGRALSALWPWQKKRAETVSNLKKEVESGDAVLDVPKETAEAVKAVSSSVKEITETNSKNLGTINKTLASASKSVSDPQTSINNNYKVLEAGIKYLAAVNASLDKSNNKEELEAFIKTMESDESLDIDDNRSFVEIAKELEDLTDTKQSNANIKSAQDILTKTEKMAKAGEGDPAMIRAMAAAAQKTLNSELQNDRVKTSVTNKVASKKRKKKK